MIRIILALFLAISLPLSAAIAKSCMPMPIEEQIKQADAIFVGESQRHLRNVDQGKMSEYATYMYKIRHAWKGVKAGDEVELSAGTYFGDQLGAQTKLIFARKQEDKLIADICYGLYPYNYPEKEIETLNEVFGRGVL